MRSIEVNLQGENKNSSKANDSDSDYPDLTEDSGEDSDSDEDVMKSHKVMRFAKCFISEAKQTMKKHKIKKSSPQTNEKNYCEPKPSDFSSNPESTINSSKSSPCCPCSGQATCAITRCPCRKLGKECTNCVPNSRGKCTNCMKELMLQPSFEISQTHQSVASQNTQVSQMQYNFNEVEIKNDISFVELKMVEAFGATLTNSAGSSFRSRLEKIWERSALLRGKIYRVPRGSVGRQFPAELAMENELLALGKTKIRTTFDVQQAYTSER